MDVEALIKSGKDLCLEGDELRQWVDTRIQEEREVKKEEREERLRKTEMEREEKLREIEREDRMQEIEREERRLKREQEREALQMQMELERMRRESPASQSSDGTINDRAPPVKAPRLPCFDDSKDLLDNYLLRFERYSVMNRWPRSDWASHLSALLSGKALQVYSRMDESEAMVYDKVKEALLRRYNLTEDGFCARFRSSRPERGERMSQFRTRIAGYLEKWIELSGKDKASAVDLIDLIIKEQIYNVCGKDLLVFLKERKPATADEMIELAENYVEAHGSAVAFAKSSSFNKDESKQITGPPPATRNHGMADKRIVCHRCSKPGHVARNCTSRAGSQVAAMKVESDMRCTFCHKRGHRSENCWQKAKEFGHGPPFATTTTRNGQGKATHSNRPSTCNSNGHDNPELKCGCVLPVVSLACATHQHKTPGMPVATGTMNGKQVTVLRDSGCSCVVVRKGLLPEQKTPSKKVLVYLANGTTVSAPLTKVQLDCPYYVGEVTAVEMETPLYDVIIGNIPGAACPGIPIEEKSQAAMAVETRAEKIKREKPLPTTPVSGLNVSPKELVELQATDVTLTACREMATTGNIRRTGRSNKTWYGYDRDVLVRYFQSNFVSYGDVTKQVVVPKDLRQSIMKIAHESILAGHLAAKKTTDRILHEFFWPNMWDDVRMFCLSCDKCQRSSPKGQTPKVPLEKVPLIDEPFKRVAVDIVGPIIPASGRGNRYILTVVDYCTRYPEAVPMKSIDTETVAEALVDIFSRIGIPQEILSDRGAQFTSDLMREVCRLLSVKQLSTTPYHPQCNGLVERFNGTLKGMIKRLATEKPSNWDRYLNAALFAYREAPQESMGFSPFELLYARPVRGPMTILRELWTNDIGDDEVKTTYQYVVDLREKMESMIDLAQQNLATASTRYKAHFDRKTKQRSFQCGDKVLLLLPTKHNKLQLCWQGPFQVLKKIGKNDYTVEVGSSRRTYHVNLLKLYHERERPGETIGMLQCAMAAVVEDEEDHVDGAVAKGLNLELPAIKQSETFRDVCVQQTLSSQQQEQVNDVLGRYEDVLTDVPGKTDVYSYDLKLTSTAPIRKKPYPVPHAMKATLREEVTAMLQAGIIEPSESPYCSPSVVVKKKDGTNRYCVDYRALNNVTLFDAEPMPTLDDLFGQIGPECNFLSKIDLSKGYWQIPLSPASRPMTAFATELGLMQFNVLPFGLQCAPAAFSRLMRKVLSGLPNVKNYIDDILIHHATWEDHIKCIEDVLNRLRQAGLTARPTKCFLGCPEIEFLGHKVGNGNIAPTTDKIKAITEAQPPQTKKQVRSFLGLLSFYRRYIPNFSAIVCPLTDATKKGMPNRIVWEEPQQRAFDYVKRVLTSEPVLRLPNFTEPFIVSTDASDTGVGAILTQEYHGEKFPVAYLSRKLLPREQRYSVVERECLALVWAIQKLSTYLVGREFILETDHTPLLYLNRAKSENGRLMRWALLLSQYRFSLRAVKGCENHGPDFLSRV